MVKLLSTVAALGAAVVLSGPVQAADFAGKRIEWIIPFQEGGGTDVWARFIVGPLSRELPGKPTIIIRNVPGGGSTTGANQFAQREIKMTTTGMTFLDMDWLNKSADGVICVRCGFVDGIGRCTVDGHRFLLAVS